MIVLFMQLISTHNIVLFRLCWTKKKIFFQEGANMMQIYRQSPAKLPDIKNIIVVTLTFMF